MDVYIKINAVEEMEYSSIRAYNKGIRSRSEENWEALSWKSSLC